MAEDRRPAPLDEVDSFNAWIAVDGLSLGTRELQPAARLSGPDFRTWLAEVTVGERVLSVAPTDEHGAHFALSERDAELGRYTRYRNRGGGVLEIDGAVLKLLPVRLWRRRWSLRDGRRRIADVLSRPNGDPRLRFAWRDGDRSTELAVLACYAILVDDIVTMADPPRRPEVWTT
jgi:hypothetical protein